MISPKDIYHKPVGELIPMFLKEKPNMKNVVKGMNKVDLIRYIYTGCYEKDEFEGVATIITSCNQKDMRKLINYIYCVSLESPNILRVMFYTLNNVELYKENKKFYFEVMKFKTMYEKKMKTLLFELGQLFYISKIDLINMFRLLIR